jgi:hypothetical protein
MERLPIEHAPNARAAMPYETKIVIGTAAITFLCLLSTSRLVTEVPSPRHLKTAASDVAERSDKRFSELRRALPEYGVVGYFGAPSESVSDYYLTQYALAPLVVDRSRDHKLVIGNFPHPPHVPPPGTETDLLLVRDFGNGVLLFEKRGDE